MTHQRTPQPRCTMRRLQSTCWLPCLCQRLKNASGLLNEYNEFSCNFRSTPFLRVGGCTQSYVPLLIAHHHRHVRHKTCHVPDCDTAATSIMQRVFSSQHCLRSHDESQSEFFVQHLSHAKDFANIVLALNDGTVTHTCRRVRMQVCKLFCLAFTLVVHFSNSMTA